MLFDHKHARQNLRDQSFSEYQAAGPVREDTPLELVAYTAILVFVSAVWYESDAYRYVGPLLVLAAFVYYLRVDFPRAEKSRIGPMGFLCVAWGIYVAVRLAYSLQVHPEMGRGTSEGIYIWPLLYATFGYALWLYVRRPFLLVTAFVLISFVVTLYCADIPSLGVPRRADSSLHQNSIHAAGAMGTIILCMLPFIAYVSRTRDISDAARASLIAVATLTFAIGLTSVYGLQSKGVWLALLTAIPFQIVLMLSMHSARMILLFAVGLAALVGLGLALAWTGIWAVAGNTYDAAGLLIQGIADKGLHEGVDDVVTDDTLPSSFRQRAMLWTSGLLLWMEKPIFGFGITWEHFWDDRAYPQARFNLIHNGYLEVAIRYGLVGLAFFTVLYAWATAKVWQAARKGLIDISAFQAYLTLLVFFCGTILTNSNIRLALGESYMMMAAGFGFYCYYLLQANGYTRPRTWI